ncbi:MAG TPA: PD-(D/E)XK nuclease family protein [Ktedonobacteraceae bacterium]|nr:PD-(D/E)XK nuclease family protein [Ktedonobacteraceae bacterium]
MRWSYSGHTVMRRCQRAYAFGYVIASHKAHDPLRSEAYVLKQLQHLSAWQGSLVHRILATNFLADLRAKRPFDPTALAVAAQALARRQLAFSAAKRYREPGQTKQAAANEYCALFEHEYGLAISPTSMEQVSTTITRCFEHLAGQREFLARLYAGSGHVAEQTLGFALNGESVTATPDLVYVERNRRLTVVDWKIAESETSDYSRQLLVYALAVARCGRWPWVRAESVQLLEANLLKNQIRVHPVSSQHLEEAEDFIYRSLVERETLIGTGRFEDLDLSEFEVAERPGTCFHCNFGSLCVQQLADTGCPSEAEVIQERLW